MTASSDRAEAPLEAATMPGMPRSVIGFGVLRAAGLAGDGAWMIATTWLLVRDHGPESVGVFLAVLAMTATLLMTPASRLADRCGVRRTLLFSDAASFLVAAGAGIALILGAPVTTLLVVTSLVLTVVAAFYRPSSSAYLQLLAPEGRLGNAMAIRQLSTSAGSILGSVAGGFLVAAGGASWIIWANALSFAVGWVGILVIRDPGDPDPGHPETSADQTPGLWVSLRGIWNDRIMRWTLARAMAVNVLGMTLTGVVLIARVNETGHTGAVLGVLEGSMASGLMVCGLVVARAKGPQRPGLVAGIAFVVASVLVTIEVAMVSVPISAVCAFGVGAALVVGGAYGDSVMLKRVDKRRLVFFHAVMMTVSVIGVPFGQALGGIVMGIGNGLVVAVSAGVMLMVISAACLAVRPLREAT